jgi:hypothetical protein
MASEKVGRKVKGGDGRNIRGVEAAGGRESR